MAANAHGMPVNVIITSGTTADCTQATDDLIEEIEAEASDSFQEEQRQPTSPFDRKYFFEVKALAGMTTRFAKTTSAFLGLKSLF